MHRAGGKHPVKANYRYVKGEGPPPVTHLPDKREPTGFTAEPARMHDLTMKDWMAIFNRWEGTDPPSTQEWLLSIGLALVAITLLIAIGSIDSSNDTVFIFSIAIIMMMAVFWGLLGDSLLLFVNSKSYLFEALVQH